MRRFVVLMLMVAATVVALAQTNRSLVARLVASNTFGPITNLSIVEGRLYFYSSSMLFSAPITSRGVGVCDVDLRFASIRPDICYVTRHPGTRQLFYSVVDSKGRTLLYECDSAGKSRQVKMSKFSHSICHPVFSSDGDIMVFASDAPKGFGGYDLWYSRYEEGTWQTPVNMGPNVNTEGDELSPSIARDYLYFSSTGRNTGGADIYATRLMSSRTLFGDTVVSFPIGRAPVQQVVSPISTELQESDFVMDESGTFGCWCSLGNFADEDSKLHFFGGRLDCVAVDVRVLTAIDDGEPSTFSVANASGRRLYEVVGDRDGSVRLYLQPGERYAVTVTHPNCFSSTFDVAALRGLHDSLYTHQQYDLFLGGFRLGFDYLYDNGSSDGAIFLSEASSNLSGVGEEILERLILFLQENPSVRMELTLRCRPEREEDELFCGLLAHAREESVRSFLKGRRVADQLMRRVSFVYDGSEDDSLPRNATVVRLTDAE